MRNADAPLFAPALAFAAGAALALSGFALSLPLLLLLAGLAFALRWRSGTALGFLACGAALAIALERPADDPLPGFDPEQPVEVLVAVEGFWSRQDSLWTAPGEVLSLRQGRRVLSPRLDVRLSLPADAGELEGPGGRWIAAASYGAVLRIRGYLTRPPVVANRVEIQRGPWRIAIKSTLLAAIERPPGLWLRLAARVREWIARGLDQVGRQEGRSNPPSQTESAAARGGLSLVRALVLGDTASVPEDWKRVLRLTGTYHLLSISGLHVAWVVALVWLLSGPLPRRLRLAAGVAALIAYLGIVGPQPALLRSALMGGAIALSLLLERPPAPRNALGLAILVLVASSPRVVLSLSFQLTVAASAGLLALAPKLAEAWKASLRLPLAVGRPLAATLAAQLSTWPFLLPRFYLLVPLSPFWNLLAIPWSGVALLLSLLIAALASVHPAWATPFARLLELWAAPLGALSHLPVSVLSPLPILVSPAAALLLSLSFGLWLFLPPRRALIAAALAVLVLSMRAGKAGSGAATEPSLAMLDVGQGDAILLRSGRSAALIDGGGWRNGGLGSRVLLPALLAEGVTRIDAVYLSHPDSDHCAGLVEIAELLPVGRVAMGEGWPEDGCAGRLKRMPGVALDLLRSGDRREVGEWNVSVLQAPSEPYLPENERSLILSAASRGRKFLLTGDAGEWAEQHLLGCCAAGLPSEVLKVGHHGSRSSSTPSFLAGVHPRLALVSVGEGNLYHHPSPQVVERLEEAGARVLRTDLLGEIVVWLRPGGSFRLELPGSPKSRLPIRTDEPRDAEHDPTP